MAKNSSKVENEKSPNSVFVGMALDMSWRLAVVVLVPILGGFYLDKTFETAPMLIILGFLLAAAGFVFVMKQTVEAANEVPMPTIVKPAPAKPKSTKAKGKKS